LPPVKAYDILRTRVAQLLAARRLSQVELAKWVEKTPAWASGFLNGKKGTTLSTVDAIAEFFNVPVRALFDQAQLEAWDRQAGDVAGRKGLDESKGASDEADLTERGGAMIDALGNSVLSSLELCPDEEREEFVRHVFETAMTLRRQHRERVSATGTSPKV
jgi:transcriptional regulator with XRE-family HTH domain